MYSFCLTSAARCSKQIKTVSQLKNCWKRSQHSNVTKLDTKTANLEVYKTTIEECMPTFYNLIDELKGDESLEGHSQRLNEILRYNVPKGKRIRIRTMVSAYKVLESIQNLNSEKLRLAYILGWCIEMVNSFTLIQDDIMDGSKERRGATCWYLVKDVGYRAITDSVLIENVVFVILKKYLRNHPCYSSVTELLHRASYIIALGQCLDNNLVYPKEKETFFDKAYTIEKYNSLIKYKTIHCIIELPILLALHLAGQYDNEAYEKIRIILLQLGTFFQVQNDFLDCFGDKSKTGKDGTDIQEGKCTWLIVKALQKASAAQRRILEQHYGKGDPESVFAVTNMYKELNIPEMYYTYSNNIYDIIYSYVRKHSDRYPPLLFTSVISTICRSEFRKQ